MRQSPLGQDLRLLAIAGYGDVSRDQVQETVGRVTDLLLRPLAAEGMVIPAWFWSSAIGKLVARAARITYGDDGLMSRDCEQAECISCHFLLPDGGHLIGRIGDYG